MRGVVLLCGACGAAGRQVRVWGVVLPCGACGAPGRPGKQGCAHVGPGSVWLSMRCCRAHAAACVCPSASCQPVAHARLQDQGESTEQDRCNLLRMSLRLPPRGDAYAHALLQRAAGAQPGGGAAPEGGVLHQQVAQRAGRRVRRAGRQERARALPQLQADPPAAGEACALHAPQLVSTVSCAKLEDSNTCNMLRAHGLDALKPIQTQRSMVGLLPGAGCSGAGVPVPSC